MGKERAGLSLDDIDLSEFQPTSQHQKEKPNQKLVEQVAEQAGFPSREAKKKRRRRKPSPYIDQLNMRCRAGMKDIFQDLGERLDVRDYTTFEKAIRALIEKEGFTDLLKEYDEIKK